MKEVSKRDAMEQQRQYTAPRVKVFDFGLSDIICASGSCTDDTACTGPDYEPHTEVCNDASDL